MSLFSRPVLALTAAMLGIAALLGGSLGVVMAHTDDLDAGFNLAGGPFLADTPPQDYVACLPANSWTAIYIWDATSQKWQHYFNTANAPAYINNPDAGGIQTIKRLAGVVILTSQAIPNAKLKDRSADSC